MKTLYRQLTIFSRIAKILSVLILYSTNSVSFAENVDYLNELESEASQKVKKDKVSAVSPAVKTKTQSAKTNISKESAYLDGLTAEANLNRLHPGLKWKEFEAVLKNTYFASYIFYKRLDPTSKSLVFKSYENKANIKQLRAEIVSLSR